VICPARSAARVGRIDELADGNHGGAAGQRGTGKPERGSAAEPTGADLERWLVDARFARLPLTTLRNWSQKCVAEAKGALPNPSRTIAQRANLPPGLEFLAREATSARD